MHCIFPSLCDKEIATLNNLSHVTHKSLGWNLLCATILCNEGVFQSCSVSDAARCADLEATCAGLHAVGGAVLAAGRAGSGDLDGVAQVAERAQVATLLGSGAGEPGLVEVAGRNLGGTGRYGHYQVFNGVADWNQVSSITLLRSRPSPGPQILFL